MRAWGGFTAGRSLRSGGSRRQALALGSQRDALAGADRRVASVRSGDSVPAKRPPTKTKYRLPARAAHAVPGGVSP